MMYAFPTYIDAGEGTLTREAESLMRWASLVLTLPVIAFSCGPFFSGAWRELRRLFAEVRKLSKETDYVVIGSLGALGHSDDVPPRMAASLDVDAWCKSDPQRIFALAGALGQGSAFEARHGYFLDPVSPRVATLPEGWEERLVRIELEAGLAAWFLEPNDAAVSKYARMEPRDREWIRAGLKGGVLRMPIIEARFRQTAFIDPAEEARARGALDEDRAWLRRALK
jgi:hypothetical protein